MPYVGRSNDLPPEESTYKINAFVRKTNVFFWYQNAWTAPYANTYVTKLFQEAPSAKAAVQGKLAVVTGVTKGGTGYYMAEELAVTAEMHVILMGRNPAKLEAAMASIRETAKSRGAPEPTLYECAYDLDDLTSADEAAAYATKLAADKYDGKLHVLINNAGANYQYYGTTKQGFEVNVGRNYICPHYLTQKLLPLLEKAGTSSYKPRVVFLSSMGHVLGGQIDPARLEQDPATGGVEDGFIKTDNPDKPYDDPIFGPTRLYGMAKYGLIADCKALTKKYPSINFTANNPGSVASNFVGNMGFAGMIYYYGFYFFQYVASQGALASLRASLDPDFNTVETLQAAYLHCDGNPWPVDKMTLGNPSSSTTEEVYTLDEYSDVLYKTVDKVIGKQLKE